MKAVVLPVPAGPTTSTRSASPATAAAVSACGPVRSTRARSAIDSVIGRPSVRSGTPSGMGREMSTQRCSMARRVSSAGRQLDCFADRVSMACPIICSVMRLSSRSPRTRFVAERSSRSGV